MVLNISRYKCYKFLMELLYENVLGNNDKYVDIEIMVHGWKNKTNLTK
jgi:hypothetical protein